MVKHVIIYMKPGCHLCDEAKLAMRDAHCPAEYSLTEINIEKDPALHQAYRNDIPVITIDGQEAFRHRLTAEEFRRRILGV